MKAANRYRLLILGGILIIALLALRYLLPVGAAVFGWADGGMDGRTGGAFFGRGGESFPVGLQPERRLAAFI